MECVEDGKIKIYVWGTGFGNHHSTTYFIQKDSSRLAELKTTLIIKETTSDEREDLLRSFFADNAEISKEYEESYSPNNLKTIRRLVRKYTSKKKPIKNFKIAIACIAIGSVVS